MAVSNKERRRHERYPTNFVLDINDAVARQRLVKAVVTDVSEGGLSFETKQKMETGSSLTLRLDLPLTVQGDIVRSEPRGGKIRYGVRFHHVRFKPEATFAKPRTMVRNFKKAA